MYDEMTITDLLVTAHQKAHPEDQPSSENALLIDELARRLRLLDNWRSKVSAEINPYLTDDDKSDLLPESERIRYMLQRLSSAQAAPAPAGDVEELKKDQAWKNAALRLGEDLALSGPEGYYAMTPEDWYSWASRQIAKSATPPADGEAGELVAWLHGQDGGIGRRAIYSRIAALLEQQQARIAELEAEQMRLKPVPVAVSDRPPTGNALCWTWYMPDEDDPSGYGGCWALLPIGGGASSFTHWLPAHALPIPTTTPAGQEGADA